VLPVLACGTKNANCLATYYHDYYYYYYYYYYDYY
jgi:hypothetical protein